MVSNRKAAKRQAIVESGLGRREQNKLDKRERIRDAAFELFSELGYDRTTTKAVAERAGVATGTLFLYAKDKPDLLFLVFHDRLRDTVEQMLATLPKAPLLGQLMHIFRGLFAMYAEHPEMGFEFVKALPGADGPNARAVNAYTFAFLNRVSDLVVDAKARGEVDERVPPMQAAMNVFALYYASLLGGLARYVSLEQALDPGLRGSLELQIQGFAPRPE
jgi:AcrR family transcriptional regulator